MTSFAASATTSFSRGTVHDVLADAFESKGDENANGFKTGGAVSCALLNRDDGPDSEPEANIKRSTIIFSREVEEGIEDPESRSFWRSHGGMIMQGLLIFVYMHFDAGLPLLQDLYKMNYGLSQDWSNSVGIADPPDDLANPDKPKMFYTKQTLLITQNFFEIICIFLLATLLRGTPRDCLNLRKTIKFAPAGACFGIQAVFGFFAMEEMGADAYALYAQTSIIVLTLAWCIMFKAKLPGTAWCGIFAIAVGMIGFKMSDAKTSLLGLTFISLKILTQCFACIYAEIFVKTDPESLYIQMAWIKPVELLITCVMTFVMSNIFPQRSRLYNRTTHMFEEVTALEAIMNLGYFHHWNWLTVVIMVFNMGDTFMTATVAKKFDSVVKGVAGVADIIYPTQLLMYVMDPKKYTESLTGPVGHPEMGHLRLISGCTIIIGSLNFVLAKGAMRRSTARKEEMVNLRKELDKQVGYSSA